jgi:hypothetical protein
MATKKKAAAKPAAVKAKAAVKASPETVCILATFEGEQFAGPDREKKLEALRAAVEKVLASHFLFGESIPEPIPGFDTHKIKLILANKTNPPPPGGSKSSGSGSGPASL